MNASMSVCAFVVSSRHPISTFKGNIRESIRNFDTSIDNYARVLMSVCKSVIYRALACLKRAPSTLLLSICKSITYSADVRSREPHLQWPCSLARAKSIIHGAFVRLLCPPILLTLLFSTRCERVSGTTRLAISRFLMCHYLHFSTVNAVSVSKLHLCRSVISSRPPISTY